MAVDEATGPGYDAALLALVTRSLEAVTAAVDPRQQICADLGALVGSAGTTYVTCRPAEPPQLCSVGAVPVDGEVERALRLVAGDARPFRFSRPGEPPGEAACLPLSLARARTTVLLLSGGGASLPRLARAAAALRAVDSLIDRLPEARVPRQRRAERTDEPLTPRELEVLRLLAEGLLARTIAGRLALSPRTVHHHLGSIYAKLGVGDRLAAVMRARAAGLLVERPRRGPTTGRTRTR